MKPVVTVEQMRAIDAAAPVSEEVLVSRAGWAVARTATQMLGGTYGRRVTVIAGPGNNGADGRVAGKLLAESGVGVRVVAPKEASAVDGDLVIDAAYGTGFRGRYDAPATDAPVLAVDVPSGLHGDTGEAAEGVMPAVRTVTFAAYKPGHFFGRGPDLCGDIELVDIGLDVTGAEISLFERHDVFEDLPRQHRNSHKWKTAVLIIAGSPGMMGAANLAAAGAQRAGAGMVLLGSPGASLSEATAMEAVSIDMPRSGWAGDALQQAERVGAIVVGPGLGRSDEQLEEIRRLVHQARVPVLIDGDGLSAFVDRLSLLKERDGATVITPHDGEFSRLHGGMPSADRVSSAKELAQASGCTVLLKGSTTVVAAPGDQTLLTAEGGPRLATAGTGDVLSGIAGAFLAMNVSPANAAASASFVHGAAAQCGYSRGLVAGDLPPLVAEWLSND